MFPAVAVHRAAVAAVPCHFPKSPTKTCYLETGHFNDKGDIVAEAMKAEDELILNKAILGHSLSEVYSNGRIQLAVNRSRSEADRFPYEQPVHREGACSTLPT